MKQLLSLVLPLLVFSDCFQKEKQHDHSRVSKFNYSGYGDTTCAILYGSVYTLKTTGNSTDTVALSNVRITNLNSNHTILTNPNGSFEMGFNKGTFDLAINKSGYQTLKISNYKADPDQVSTIAIILVKGQGTSEYHIPTP